MTDKQPDILEALTELAEAQVGGKMPKCLTTNGDDGINTWGTALSEIARRAKATIIDLRKACDIYEKMCRDEERRS